MVRLVGWLIAQSVVRSVGRSFVHLVVLSVSRLFDCSEVGRCSVDRLISRSVNLLVIRRSVFRSCIHPFVCLVGRSVDRSVDWSVSCLEVSRLFEGPSFVRSVGGSFGRSVFWLVGWSFGRLTVDGQLVGRSVDWLVESKVITADF